MGSLWLRPVTVSSCIHSVLGWAVGRTGLNMTHATRCCAEKDVNLVWSSDLIKHSGRLDGWDCLYQSTSVCVNMRRVPIHWSLLHRSPHSAPVEGWKEGDESLSWNAWTSRSCRVKACDSSCEWVHVSAGGTEAVIHSELHFVCEQNWFWCPGGVQAASCCVL